MDQSRMDSLELDSYGFRGMSEIPSPQLIFYEDLIEQNIQTIIELAKGADNLWPHIKTGKSADVVKLMLAAGIERFKCATIAEAEMLADLDAPYVCLAYTLVGPAVKRYRQLIQAYPDSEFFTIVDSQLPVRELDSELTSHGLTTNLLIDVDFGQHRTGLRTAQLDGFIDFVQGLSNVRLRGFHCYDGDIHDSDYDTRLARVSANHEALRNIIGEDNPYDVIIWGGSPSFTSHVRLASCYFSPGTYFLNDRNYYTNYQEVPCLPAALILSRVISHPGKGLFTLDAGYKAVSADAPMETRAYIMGFSLAKPVLQNEEHWVWELPEGEIVPKIGQELLLIPGHICPTVALYDEALAVRALQPTGYWGITARGRKISI